MKEIKVFIEEITFIYVQFCRKLFGLEPISKYSEWDILVYIKNQIIWKKYKYRNIRTAGDFIIKYRVWILNHFCKVKQFQFFPQVS